MRFPTTSTFCAGGARKRRQLGFTFAEVLAALVFMAIVIPVAMQGLQIANRAGAVAARKSTAVQLGDEKLNELILTDLWRNSTTGDFGPSWPSYRWQLRNDVWTGDPYAGNTMRVLTMEVSYTVQNQRYVVRLSTLVNNTGL